jgi:hypothetical protein
MQRQLTIIGTTSLLAVSCGMAGSADERTAEVYVAVIQAVADAGPGDFSPDDGYEDRVIYAGPLDDNVEIPLEVQATVVEELRDADFATVRFVDEQQEAVRADEEHEPVQERGVMVLLGDVPEGSEIAVQVHRYLDNTETASFTVEAVEMDDTWTVSELEMLPPE